MAEYEFESLNFEWRDEPDVLARAEAFRQTMVSRRSIREFASTPIPIEVIRHAIDTANHAPSGANRQPWHFVAVRDPARKRQIREAAEAEERELYAHRASEEWLEALAPLGTDENKPFLETAPWLIAVFAQKHSFTSEGRKRKHYYTPESVGIATGFLIAALHQAGLGTLTHTPSPMGFLRELLERPDHERPYLLLVTGYPSRQAQVPCLTRRSLDEVMTLL